MPDVSLSSERSSRGLADVVAAATAVTEVDGRGNRLAYRGYDVADVAAHASFEECAFLLLRGALPTREELDGFQTELTAGAEPGPVAGRVLDAVGGLSPMAALRTLVSAAEEDLPTDGSADGDDDDPGRDTAAVVAQVPTLLGSWVAARRGNGPRTDRDRGLAAVLLAALTGTEPDDTTAASFEQALILHADHALNASTLTARLCAATGGSTHAAVTAAAAVLGGPLHGGALEAVTALLEGVDSEDAAAAAVSDRLDGGGRVAGFGHRIYRGEDPRTGPLRELARGVAEHTGDDGPFRAATALEEVVMERAARYPNADLYTAALYRMLGVPRDLGTAVLAAARTAGWAAHILEQRLDNRLIRPEGEYVGEVDRRWVPLGERTAGGSRTT